MKVYDLIKQRQVRTERLQEAEKALKWVNPHTGKTAVMIGGEPHEPYFNFTRLDSLRYDHANELAMWIKDILAEVE